MRIHKAQVPVVGVYLPLAGGTMVGDIQMGANKLKTTNLLLKEGGVTRFVVRGVADAFYCSLQVQDLILSGRITSWLNGGGIDANDADANTLTLRARDTGVGLATVARLVGAADPYLEATLPMLLLPVATASLPATPVEGMIGYNATLDKITYRDAGSWQTLEPISIIRKTANEIVNNSDVLQNDNHLLKALAANEVWEFTLRFIYDSSVGADIKFLFTMPAGCVVRGQYFGYAAGVYTFGDVNPGPAIVLDGLGVGNIFYCEMRGVIINAGTAGNWQLQWAQNTAEVSDTTVRANSVLIMRKIA